MPLTAVPPSLVLRCAIVNASARPSYRQRSQHRFSLNIAYQEGPVESQTLRYRDNGSIELYVTEIHDPQEGEVQVTGGACGICSWDVVTAKLGAEMIPMAPPGHEGVGYVSKIGAGVTGFKEGDRVAGGGFATVRNLSSERIYPIPTSNLADEFWIVEPVACAVTGIDQTNLRAGETVALIGCGFMGQLLLQGLLHSPAGNLIAIDIVEDRLELARKQGADETINLTQLDRDDLAATLKARDIDVVVDASGSQPGLDLAADIVKSGGRINLFGWIKGQKAFFDPTKWHLGGFTIVNSSPSSKIRNTFLPAIRLIDAGVFDLKPLVTHITSLGGYPSLMEEILAGDESYVKGVVSLK